VVGNIIITLLQIVRRMRQWKNFGNWSISGDNMDKSKVPRFLAHPVDVLLTVGFTARHVQPVSCRPSKHQQKRLCHSTIVWNSWLYFKFLCLVPFYARKQLLLSAHLSHHNSVRLSVCPSVTQVDQSKTVQDRITKSSPSPTWKTLVSGFVKLFHKFEGSHLEWGR